MKKKLKSKKLKPVVFIKGHLPYHSNNKFQQNLLLDALQITTDPVKLKQMAGLRTVADVYRTLDKLSMRKSYHEALGKHGLDLDFIVKGIKKICKSSKSEAIRLRGFQALLKSIGLDEYKESVEESSKNWEDLLKTAIEAEKQGKLPSGAVGGDYDVVVPETPDDEKRRIEEGDKYSETLYE